MQLDEGCACLHGQPVQLTGECRRRRDLSAALLDHDRVAVIASDPDDGFQLLRRFRTPLGR
jgi:hypothetical protein